MITLLHADGMSLRSAITHYLIKAHNHQLTSPVSKHSCWSQWVCGGCGSQWVGVWGVCVEVAHLRLWKGGGGKGEVIKYTTAY